MGCEHQRYKNGQYMTGARIARTVADHKKNTICYYSARINNCEDCGADISYADIHLVMDTEQYLKTLGINPADTRKRRESKTTRLLRKQGQLNQTKLFAEAESE